MTNAANTRRRRPGFTLAEALLASLFTATACTAAAMLIKTINDTAATSGGMYAAVASGRDAIGCMDMLVEEAPLLGFRDNDRILIWRNDDNGNGQMDLLELTLIAHNAATHDLSLQDVRLPAAAAGNPALNPAVPLSQFITQAGAQLVEQDSNVCTRRLVGGLSAFRAWCDAAGTDARTAQVDFTVTRDDGSQAFHMTTSLRAPMQGPVP